MDFIKHSTKFLHKVQRINTAFGIAIIGLGILGLNLPVKEGDERGVFWTCIVVMAFGASFFYTVWKKAPKNNKLYKALTNDKDKIERVYVRQNYINGAHNSTVIDFVFKDGSLETVQIPKNEQDIYLDEIRKILPDVKYGYEDPLKENEGGRAPVE